MADSGYRPPPVPVRPAPAPVPVYRFKRDDPNHRSNEPSAVAQPAPDPLIAQAREAGVIAAVQTEADIPDWLRQARMRREIGERTGQLAPATETSRVPSSTPGRTIADPIVDYGKSRRRRSNSARPAVRPV